MLTNEQKEFLKKLKDSKKYNKINFDKAWLKDAEFIDNLISFLVYSEKKRNNNIGLENRKETMAMYCASENLLNDIIILESIVKRFAINLEKTNIKSKDDVKNVYKKMVKNTIYIVNHKEIYPVFDDDINKSFIDMYKECLKNNVRAILKMMQIEEELGLNLTTIREMDEIKEGSNAEKLKAVYDNKKSRMESLNREDQGRMM